MAAACATNVDDAPPIAVQADAAGATVQSYVDTDGCSTAVVIGLSKQIAQEAGCADPNSFVSFQGATGITLASSAVLPFLQKDARTDLEAVAKADSLDVTSALRTLAQQYLLYEWFEQGKCGITAAATVGNSNHEGGRAVDLGNYSDRVTAMADHGWAHDVPGDVVHFDHTASPDDRGEDIRAFQVLWNANNPSDPIGVDGEYGPETEARLQKSPAAGFAIGASCATGSLDADVVSVAGPDQAPPQTQEHYTIVVKNTGHYAWPAGTEVALGSGSDSPLYDPSWTSQTVVTKIAAAVAIDGMTTIDMDVTTPNVTTSTPITQTFELDDAGTKFGTIDLSLTVAPDAGSGDTGEGDGSDDGSDDTGSDSPTMPSSHAGCNAGGAGSSYVAFALFGLALRRRKR
ncbi:MAG TPA: M15 family metallopeptidase [Kofleriaceae bacterium]|nr:M15 family metallopeptidase [Kofleriaceae bacterium]